MATFNSSNIVHNGVYMNKAGTIMSTLKPNVHLELHKQFSESYGSIAGWANVGDLEGFNPTFKRFKHN